MQLDDFIVYSLALVASGICIAEKEKDVFSWVIICLGSLLFITRFLIILLEGIR